MLTFNLTSIFSSNKISVYFTIAFLFFLTIVGFTGTQCKAQSESKFDTRVEGQLSVTTNGKLTFLSIGGVSLKLVCKKFTFGVMMGPSLKFQNEASKITIVPVLGVGPQLYFLKNKRFFLSFPAYYIATKKIWTQSAGIGYVLSKPR
jgi:hypothetical protein